MISTSFLALIPFILGVNAANDWNVPCTTGSCAWDLPAGSASGTMKIWGSNTAISDITTAANWQILGCNSTALSQSVRLVCMNDPEDPDSLCSHLYGNSGAVNKIIRLPTDCGAGPFARVSQWGTSNDQSIPASVNKRLTRRAGNPPVVHVLAMDTNFDAVDYSKTGAVNIAIQGANVPGAPNTIAGAGSGSQRRSRTRRGLGSIVSGALSSVKNGIDNAASSVKNAAEDVGADITSVAGAAATEVKNVATKAAGAVKGVATKVESAAKSEATKVKNAAGKVESAAKAVATKVEGAAKAAVSDIAAATNNTVDVNHTFNLPPITFDKSKNLLSKSIQCGPVGATISADVDANANAQMTVSLAATGTIIPPKLTDFGVVAGMSGSAAGTMTINADVTGSLDSGLITLVNLGVPGFDIPGIFTVGPSFQVNAELTGDVDVAMAMTLGVNLNLNNAQLAFPPGAADPTASNAFSLGDTPITLNAAPNVDATGTITAHLIPSLNLGISALGKKADATISLSLDANAGLTMNLDGSASATKVVEPNPNADDAGSQPADVSGTIGGCINVNGGVDVTASADADFFGLFDKSTSANLFSKNFQILQKCFGDQAPGAQTVDNSTDASTAVDSATDGSTTDDSGASADDASTTSADGTDASTDDSSSSSADSSSGDASTSSSDGTDASTDDSSSSSDDSSSGDGSDSTSTSADDASTSSTGTSKRFSRRRTPRLSRSERRTGGFLCPAAGAASPVPVAEETVKASSITATDGTAKAPAAPAPAKTPTPSSAAKSSKTSTTAGKQATAPAKSVKAPAPAATKAKAKSTAKKA